MEDFEKIEHEIEGNETKINVNNILNQLDKIDEEEQTTIIGYCDQGTQTYEEDFEELDEINFIDDMEKISLEIIDGIKKGFKTLVMLFTDIKIDTE